MSDVHPTKRRRWLTISLRGLLLVFTVGVLGLGWYANRALRQRAAVRAIEAKGGRISYGYNDPTVSVRERPAPPLAAWLGIDFVDGVTVVELIGPQFDDEDLVLLDDLRGVHWLRIYETQVTGKTFRHVSRCPKITSLLVNHCPLEDSALAEIGRMPQLVTLHLVDTKITDQGVGALTGLPKLKDVSLSECAITHAGLAQVELPDTLESLSLENTRIGDEGIEQLERLPALRRLSLYGAPVTDASIGSLAQMPQLEAVMLGSTKVTTAGLQQLRAATGRELYISPDPDGNP